MTGGSDIRERVGAVFFAVVMVTSMMAIGGFAGTAGADDTDNPAIVQVEAEGGAGASTIFVSFDEEVYGSSNGDEALEASDFEFELNGGNQDEDIASVSAVSGGSNPGSAVYALSLDSGGVGDGDVESGDVGTSKIDVVADSVFDASGNKVTVDGGSALTIEDSGPFVAHVEVEANDGATGTIYFTEPVEDGSDQALDSSDITYNDVSTDSVSDITGISHSSGEAVASIDSLTGGPFATSDLGSDTVQAVTGNVDDVTGDTDAQGTTATVTDTSVPRIASATTVDSGSNGGVDRIDVTLTEPVDDDAGADITGGSNSISDVFTISGLGDASAASDALKTGSSDDDTVRINLDDTVGTTGITPTIELKAGTLQDNSNENSLSSKGPAVTVSDGAAPQIVDRLTRDDGDAPGDNIGGTDTTNDNAETDNDGVVDQVEITFSEDIDDSTVDTSDYVTDQGANPSIDTITTGSAGDDETIFLDIEGLDSSDGTAVSNFNVDYGGATDDLAGNNLADDDSGVSDGAPPVMTSATTSGVDSNNNVNEITVGFSENLGDGSNFDADGPPTTNLFSLSVGAVSGYNDGDATGDANYRISVTGISGSSATPDVTLEAGTIDVEDRSGQDNALGSDQTIESNNGVSATLNGDSNSDIATDIGSDGNGFDRVLAGNASEQLGLIRIQDASGGSSPLAAQTTLEMPDGITINESASDFTITTTSGDLEVTDSAVENGGSTLVLEHGSTSSEGGQTIRIQGVVVDVAPNASASQAGVRGPDNDVTVSYAISELDTSLFQVQKAGVDFEPNDNPGTFGAGTTDNTLNDDIRVTAPANLDGGIAGGSDLVINANQSNGVTFNTDFDPTTLTASGGVPGKVDTSSASLSETQLTIPVTGEFDQGESVTIDTDGSLPVDLAGDAQASQLTASFRTNQSTGDVAALTGSGNQIGVNRPVVDLGDDDVTSNEGTTTEDVANRADSIVVGKNNQQSTAEDLSISLTSAGQISDGSDVIITTNRSDVTFDTDASITNDGDNTLDVAGPEAEITANADGSEAISSTNIEENRIVLAMDGGTDGYEGDEVVALDDFPLEVASSAPDNARVSFNVTTEPSAGTTVLSQEADTDFIGLERPDISLNGDTNVTVDLDSDGTQTFVDPVTDSSGAADGSQDALVIDSDDVGGQIVSGQTITIALESNTGVTFSQTQSVDLVDAGGLAGLDNQADDGVDSDDTVDIDVSDDTDFSNLQTSQTEISFEVDSDLDANDRIHVDQLYLNASASAQDTTVSVTTDTGDNEVTTVDNKLIKINSVEPSNVFGDANIQEDSNDADVGPDLEGDGNGDFGGVNSEEATDDGTTDDRPVVDETITSRVHVQDGGSAFGGATVDLELVQTPDGSSGASLNTTSIVTEANGVAAFDFTVGDTNGIYVVNASTASGSVNITYDAEPGEVANVNVTPIENAIVGGSNDLDQAALFVNATDANGNPVSATPTVDVTADNVGASEIGAFEDKDPDGSRNDLTSPDDDLTDGEFTIDDTNNDGSSVIEINSDQVEDVTVTVSTQGNSDSGTVTFFDNVGQVDLALNQSTVEVDDTVAAEATISESDGTPIEVPGVTVNYDDNNNGNTTFAGGPDSDSASTNDAGVASVNVTAEQLGSSTIDVQTNLRSDSATLDIVENAGAQVQLANVNLDPSSVSANTTNDHDLTFDAVNVSDDGNTDSFTVTIPSAATLESANSVSVVDANGTDVSLSGGPDVSGNEITFDVAPDSSADTRTLSVTANVTVAAPDVENETTADITVDVSDSNNGQDSADVTLTVAPADADPEDPVDRFDTNGEPGIQSGEVLNAISAFNEDTRIGGEPVESGDVLDVISAFNEA